MRIQLEIDEITLKKLIVDYLQRQLVEVEMDTKDIQIEVKSKQNHKSEWEVAAFRATINKSV